MDDLRGNCLMAIGEYKKALAMFTRMCNDFTDSELIEPALEKIKQCRAKLQEGDANETEKQPSGGDR